MNPFQYALTPINDNWFLRDLSAYVERALYNLGIDMRAPVTDIPKLNKEATRISSQRLFDVKGEHRGYTLEQCKCTATFDTVSCVLNLELPKWAYDEITSKKVLLSQELEELP